MQKSNESKLKEGCIYLANPYPELIDEENYPIITVINYDGRMHRGVVLLSGARGEERSYGENIFNEVKNSARRTPFHVRITEKTKKEIRARATQQGLSCHHRRPSFFKDDVFMATIYKGGERGPHYLRIKVKKLVRPQNGQINNCDSIEKRFFELELPGIHKDESNTEPNPITVQYHDFCNEVFRTLREGDEVIVRKYQEDRCVPLWGLGIFEEIRDIFGNTIRTSKVQGLEGAIVYDTPIMGYQMHNGVPSGVGVLFNRPDKWENNRSTKSEKFFHKILFPGVVNMGYIPKARVSTELGYLIGEIDKEEHNRRIERRVR
jgi:hypothetical protein